MFLLRCTFWLSVVYASMSWGGTALHSHGSFSEAVESARPQIDAVARKAVDASTAACVGREASCLQQAAAMTALVQSTLLKDAEDLIVDDAPEVPLPPPAPRHRTAAALLTPSS